MHKFSVRHSAIVSKRILTYLHLNNFFSSLRSKFHGNRRHRSNEAFFLLKNSAIKSEKGEKKANLFKSIVKIGAKEKIRNKNPNLINKKQNGLKE